MSEVSIVRAIEDLLAAGMLAHKGAKYPTVWLPGKPVRAAKASASSGATPPRQKKNRRPRYNSVVRELENYRRRKARALKWKSYMVFQRRAVVAIDQRRPQSLSELLAVPGLGPAKVERFGDDILDIVRRFGHD